MEKFICLICLMLSLTTVFGATLVYDDDGTMKTKHVEMYEQSYITFVVNYFETGRITEGKDHDKQVENITKNRSGYVQYILDDGSQLWLDAKEELEMLRTAAKRSLL